MKKKKFKSFQNRTVAPVIGIDAKVMINNKPVLLPKDLRILSPEEILQHCANTPVPVPVPGWGENVAVECVIPESSEILAMQLEHGADKAAFHKALFKKCLKGFTADQINQLENANYLKYIQLFQAVMQKSDLFATALDTEKLGKQSPC